MKADVVPLCFRDACYIAANIRQEDWDECRCQMDEEVKIVLAQLSFFGTEEGLRWCARLDGQPVAAFGVIRSGPTLYQLWMWSTPRLLRVMPAIVRFLDVHLRDCLLSLGATRLELRAMETHQMVSMGWLEKAGATFVCRLPQYGKNGEDFRLYAWWRGMPDAKDVRTGYDRVRRVDYYSPVQPWSPPYEHGGYGSCSGVGGHGVYV